MREKVNVTTYTLNQGSSRDFHISSVRFSRLYEHVWRGREACTLYQYAERMHTTRLTSFRPTFRPHFRLARRLAVRATSLSTPPQTTLTLIVSSGVCVAFFLLLLSSHVRHVRQRDRFVFVSPSRWL